MEKIRKKDLKEFGFIWAGIFFIMGVIPYLKHVKSYNNSLFVVSIIFIVISLYKPNYFESFYKIWIKFGEFIGNYISKIVLFILYFAVFTPISLLLKLLGKDLLNKKIDKNTATYWIDRDEQPQSMKYQF